MISVFTDHLTSLQMLRRCLLDIFHLLENIQAVVVFFFFLQLYSHMIFIFCGTLIKFPPKSSLSTEHCLSHPSSDHVLKGLFICLQLYLSNVNHTCVITNHYHLQVEARHLRYRENFTVMMNSFNIHAGAETATPYLDLAFETMSRHFRYCILTAPCSIMYLWTS
jgi:hypothetical protein